MNAHEKDNPPVWARGLDGHVALVTGAGRGLGRACALALSGAGARIIAVSRTGAELAGLAEAPRHRRRGCGRGALPRLARIGHRHRDEPAGRRGMDSALDALSGVDPYN